MDSSPLATQLSKTSAAYQDPVQRIDWNALNAPGYWIPREALSLAGLPQFEAQDPERQQLLSKLEFLNFLEGGIWLEALFMERMAQVLRHQRLDLTHLKYRAHEIREEAGHTLMFLEVMQRAGHRPSGQRKLPRTLELFARHAPGESLEFWLGAILGEDVPDQMNRYIRRHAGGINPAILQVCTLHVMDEARHIAYGRELVRQRAGSHSRARLRLASALTSRLLRQFLGVFYYPPATLYEAAGLRPGAAWRRAALHNPHRADFLRQLLEPSLRLLHPLGLILTLP
ncbi:MAG TPA: diiron oxygenase [Acidiferrobacteraceae bacterium]|nr:diiron oxygenase [Acidiferrobacteraceae bacterium]